MIDWLKRRPADDAAIIVAGRPLPLVIRRLGHARRMTLRLAPDGSEVRLSIPRWGRTAEAVRFARSRADWLAAQYAALPRREPVSAQGRVPFRGEMLEIAHVPAAPRAPRVEAGRIVLGGPSESVPARLQRWLQKEARLLLAQDLAHYCAAAGQDVPGLSLSGARRRWGSCSAKGVIRINWRLVMAPDAVRRSVVAHEVAHLVHFDHSPRFHALLGEIFDADLPAANAWLKREGQSLYGYFG